MCGASRGVRVCVCVYVRLGGYKGWGVFVCGLLGVQYVTVCLLLTELKIKSCNGITETWRPPPSVLVLVISKI